MPNKRDQVLKYVLSTDFSTGGYLPESKAKKFVTSIGKYSTLLGMCRRVQLKTKDRNKVPKLHFTGPITRGSTERTYNAATHTIAPSELSITAHKVESRTEITMDSLLENIEFEGFEKTYMNLTVQQISEDYENLALNGDTSLSGTDPVSLLLKVFDGWYKQSNNAHILDAGGYPIQKDIFAAAAKKMPKRYRKSNKARLKFFVSDGIWQDWMVLNSGRSDALGMRAMNGDTIKPFGYPIVPIPLFADDLAIDASEATAAYVKATREAYVKITTGVNDAFRMDIDNGGATTVTLTAGVYTPEEIKSHLNSLFSAEYFHVDAFGRLYIVSPTTGASSEIDIQTVANSCYETLGFTVGVTTGADAGSGVTHDGSYMILTDPLNLIFGMFHKIRYSREYDQDYDVIKAVWFAYIGSAIEELDMMVRVDNIKNRELFS